MKKVISIVAICAFMFSAFTAQAEEYCEYDAVGTILQFQPPYLVGPNGSVDAVTFGVQNGWWNDDVFGCYEAYKAPALLPILPRCDQDGNGVVDIAWLADMYYFILNFGPSASALYSAPCVDGCYDLGSLDFGAPSMPLGAAMIDGSCTMIFGTTVPPQVTPYIYSNVAACEAACAAGCDTNDECAANEYCFFEDYTCGPAGTGVCTPMGEICTGQYDPVCSCGFQTVSNACMATVFGKSIMADGECAPEDTCNYNGGSWNGTDCDCPAGTTWNSQRGCELD